MSSEIPKHSSEVGSGQTSASIAVRGCSPLRVQLSSEGEWCGGTWGAPAGSGTEQRDRPVGLRGNQKSQSWKLVSQESVCGGSDGEARGVYQCT